MNNDPEKIEASSMSMRDVFASRAMTGLVSGIAMAPNGTSELADLAEKRGIAPHEVVDVSAYRYADAMLKARMSTIGGEVETKVSDEQLAKMLAGLDGVTPGPWTFDGSIYNDMGAGIRAIPSDRDIAQLWKSGTVAIDAAHIARCDPDTLRSLIVELQARRSDTR